MPSKKSSHAHATPKISGSAALTASGATAKQLGRSAILKHAFSPSQLQLNLFASVVQGLSGQELRLHDTLTGQLRSQHTIHGGEVSCLDWGLYGSEAGDDRPSKKRKTKGGSTLSKHEQGDAVIAIGTRSSSDIELFSPTKSKVVAILSEGNAHGIKDFKFLDYGRSHKAWSLGGDGKLVEWSTKEGSVSRSIQLPQHVAASNVILPLRSTVLCAKSSIYTVEVDRPHDVKVLPGFTSDVHTLAVHKRPSGDDEIAAIIGAASSERSVIKFNYASLKLEGQMVAQDTVERIHLATAAQSQEMSAALAAVTARGEVELFEKPFEFDAANPKLAKSAKAAKKGLTKRATAVIKIARPSKLSEHVPILDAEFDGSDLVIAWIEGATHPCFDRQSWRDVDGSIKLSGEIVVEKSKSQDHIINARMNGVDLGRTHVDDSNAVIVKADAVDGMEIDEQGVIEISSAEEGSSSDEEADEVDEVPEGLGSEQQTLVNDAHRDGQADSDAEMQSGSDAEGNNEAEAPSFGDLLRAKAPEPVDVAAAFPAKAQTALVPQGEKSVSFPAGMSLSAVLAQSLRTNDRELLETCFHEQDLQVVRATIQRLDSALAGTLLERLAERLHHRPGRAGSLMVWIQWTLVAHGGHLAGRPSVVRQMRQLHGIVKERAQALQPLLLLKGKLDMLEAQMQLRKGMLERSRLLQAAQEDEEEEAIYVEGQVEVDSDDEQDAPIMPALPEPGAEDIEFDSDEEAAVEAMGEEEEEDDDEDGSQSGNELIDDEAEEDDDENSEIDEEEVDYDDVESVDDGESEVDSEADAPAGRAGSKGKGKVNGIVKRR